MGDTDGSAVAQRFGDEVRRQMEEKIEGETPKKDEKKK